MCSRRHATTDPAILECDYRGSSNSDHPELYSRLFAISCLASANVSKINKNVAIKKCEINKLIIRVPKVWRVQASKVCQSFGSAGLSKSA